MDRQFQMSAKAESKPKTTVSHPRLLQSSWGEREPSPPSERVAPPPVLHEALSLPVRASNGPIIIQPKLTIGPAGDKYEQEADRIASQVVNQINAPQALVQREDIQRREDEDKLQRKPLLQLQPLAGNRVAASPQLESEIGQSRSGGQPLALRIRGSMEQAFGADFSGVRVHADAQADRMNRSISAIAFTTGQNMFFLQGAYQPGSKRGQELIAHELTHVLQQGGGRHWHLQRVNVEDPTIKNTEQGGKEEVSGVKHQKFAKEEVIDYIKLTQDTTIKEILKYDLDGGVCRALVTIISMFIQLIGGNERLNLKALEKALLNYIIKNRESIRDMQEELSGAGTGERSIKTKLKELINIESNYLNIIRKLKVGDKELEIQQRNLGLSEMNEPIEEDEKKRKEIEEKRKKINEFKVEITRKIDEVRIQHINLEAQLEEEKKRTGYEVIDSRQEEYIGSTELVYENKTNNEVEETDITAGVLPAKRGETTGYLIMVPGHMMYAMSKHEEKGNEQYITYDPNEGFVQLKTYSGWIKQIISLFEEYCGKNHSQVAIKKMNSTSTKKISSAWLKKTYGVQ